MGKKMMDEWCALQSCFDCPKHSSYVVIGRAYTDLFGFLMKCEYVPFVVVVDLAGTTRYSIAILYHKKNQVHCQHS